MKPYLYICTAKESTEGPRRPSRRSPAPRWTGHLWGRVQSGISPRWVMAVTRVTRVTMVLMAMTMAGMVETMVMTVVVVVVVGGVVVVGVTLQQCRW